MSHGADTRPMALGTFDGAAVAASRCSLPHERRDTTSRKAAQGASAPRRQCAVISTEGSN